MPAKRKRLVEEAWGDVKDEISPVSFEPAKIAVHAWLMEHGHMSGGIYATRKKNRNPDYFWSHSGSVAIGILSGLVGKCAISSIVTSGGGDEDIQEYIDKHTTEVSLALEGDSLSSIRETVTENSELPDSTGSKGKKETGSADAGLSTETVLLLVLGAAAVYLIMKK